MATEGEKKASSGQPKIVALVPMRHNSERVPGKNYRLMAGKPLFHHIMETLLAVEEIAEVMVDTDSPIVMEGLEKHFPTVKRIQRPPHLVDGNIPMNEILLHDTAQVEADYYLQTHSTNPVLTSATVKKAIQSFLEGIKEDKYDSLFSVTPLQTRLYDHEEKPVNHNPNELLRTQDLPPVYEDNSCIYIFKRETLIKRKNRIGERPLMFKMDPKEALDIDVELDFLFCDLVLTQKLKEQEEAKTSSA